MGKEKRNKLQASSQVTIMVKNSPANAGDAGSILGSKRSPWRRAWQPASVFLPGESHGQRGLAGYSPWSNKDLDMTEGLSTQHTHTHIYINILH